TGGNSNSAGTGSKDWYNKNYGAINMVYDARLNLKTSFTGKDLLYSRLRTGNFNNSPFGGNGIKLTKFDRENKNGDIIKMDRLYYRFPVGKEFKVAVGPIARNTEFLGTKPFYYAGWSGLDFFQLNGAPGTYNKITGSLLGAIWKQKVKKGNPYFTVSSSYVTPNGANGNPQTGGIATENSKASWLTQIGFNAKQWKATFGWNYTQCGNKAREGTQAAMQSQACNYGNKDLNSSGNAFAVGLAWRPKNTGIVPSVSTGWGYNSFSYSNLSYVSSKRNQTGAANSSTTGKPGIAGNLADENIAATQSWTVGLQWNDAFAKGNTGGFAIGQPTFVTATRNGTTPFDAGYVMEGFYKFQVSDNIAVTPVLFYMSNPSSAGAGYAQTSNQGSNLGVFGGALTTRIKF
ncbi:MAG: iron uptake porin, partial [Cyanobacteria bacterium]|nr:iron uptake porin [Cyanobacteriota bacterium]